MWTCKKCGSQLAHRSRSRSCNAHIVAQFLTRKERSTRALYFAVAKLVAACGPYTLTTWKYGVTFVAKQPFASVNRNEAGRLDIHFALPRRLKSARIWKIDRPVGKVYMHHLHVRIADLDDELAGWIRASYVEHGKRTADQT